MESLTERIEIFKHKPETYYVSSRTLMSGKVISGDIIYKEGLALVVNRVRYSKKTKNFFFHCTEIPKSSFAHKFVRVKISERHNVVVSQIIKR